MRRLPAILLLVLFSLSLMGPALFADNGSELPACCRRDGKHRCSMRMAPAQQRTGPAFESRVERCPYYPAAPGSASHRGYAPATAAHQLPWAPPQTSYALPSNDTRPGSTFARTRRERGPPLFFA